MSTLVALGFGGNLTEPIATIHAAIEHLRITGILTDLTVSHFYRTTPWGGAEGSDFINVAVTGVTDLDAEALLDRLHSLETEAGRVHSQHHYEARILDIDILLFGEQIVENGKLTIPHPFLAERRFVLVPLAEIAEGWTVPTKQTTVRQLLQSCRDTLKVEQIAGGSGTEEPS